MIEGFKTFDEENPRQTELKKLVTYDRKAPSSIKLTVLNSMCQYNN
jgi:hypothetical protein